LTQSQSAPCQLNRAVGTVQWLATEPSTCDPDFVNCINILLLETFKIDNIVTLLNILLPDTNILLFIYNDDNNEILDCNNVFPDIYKLELILILSYNIVFPKILILFNILSPDTFNVDNDTNSWYI